MSNAFCGVQFVLKNVCLWLNRSPFAYVFLCVCLCFVVGDVEEGLCIGECVCVCVRMLYLFDTDFLFVLLCSALAPQHTLQITLQIQYTSCVFWVWVFSVNFNVDMYLVLRSPISRR